MRLLHIADLHLGRAFDGLSLDDDHEAALEQILRALIDRAPDALIIAGDVFDRAAPSASAVRQFNRFLTRVARETEAAVVIIAGNHDSGDRIGAMAVLTDGNRALISGAVDAEEPPLILRDAHGTVAISALPFAYEHAASDAFGDETIASPEDVLRVQLAAARARLPEGARWVVVAHAFVSGATSSEGERPLARVGGVETVPAALFEGACYVALGHLHRPQCVGAPHIRYAGAPLAFGFDEANEPKSMSMVEIDAAGGVSVEPIPFAPSRGVRVLRGTLAELLRAPPSDDFVKAVLEDETPPLDPMRRLREVFPNACRLAFARDERAPEAKAVASSPARAADPMAVVGDFLEQVRGEGPSPAELSLVAEALQAIRRAERAA